MVNLKNRITGFVFGKYNLRAIAKELLIKREEYVSGFENIYYDVSLLVGSLISSVLLIILAILFSPWLFFSLLLPPFVIFFALELELVFLSNERVFIERRGTIEKLFKTRNIISISLEQIAVLSYKRAPVNIPALAFGMITVVGSILIAIFGKPTLKSPISSLVLLISILVAISQIAVLWGGLRLNKRSIELSVIGVAKAIGIGRTKGAPQWFLEDVQELVFERIHHYESAKKEQGIEAIFTEFPFRHSASLKRAIQNLETDLERRVLLEFDRNELNFDMIKEKFPDETEEKLDEVVNKLKQRKFIHFKRDKSAWALSRENL